LLSWPSHLLEAKTKGDVEKKDSYYGSQTQLSHAVSNRREAVVKLLFEAKADVEPKDSSSCTPLWWATAKGHEAVVKQLLDTEPDVESKDSPGQTLLLPAAVEGYKAVVKQLLETKADIESKDLRSSISVKFSIQSTFPDPLLESLHVDREIESKKMRVFTSASKRCSSGKYFLGGIRSSMIISVTSCLHFGQARLTVHWNRFVKSSSPMHHRVNTVQ
jgi:Ankyrin repeats (3 copies)